MLLPEYSGLKKVVELPKLTVHVVGDRKDFNWEKARNPKSGIAAYANTNGEIWVLGRMSDGEIMVNWVILGHELTHILRFHDPEFADPDNNK